MAVTSVSDSFRAVLRPALQLRYFCRCGCVISFAKCTYYCQWVAQPLKHALIDCWHTLLRPFSDWFILHEAKHTNGPNEAGDSVFDLLPLPVPQPGCWRTGSQSCSSVARIR